MLLSRERGKPGTPSSENPAARAASALYHREENLLDAGEEDQDSREWESA